MFGDFGDTVSKIFWEETMGKRNRKPFLPMSLTFGPIEKYRLILRFLIILSSFHAALFQLGILFSNQNKPGQKALHKPLKSVARSPEDVTSRPSRCYIQSVSLERGPA